MTALAAERRLREETWSKRSFTLASGNKGFKGGIAVWDQSVGKVVVPTTAAGSTDQVAIGTFAETVDATAADKPVVIHLKREIRVKWFANDDTNPVTATDLLKTVYTVDDQTVSILNTNRAATGLAWALDATLGVAVEMT